jgi:hypothetical protein
MQGETGDKGRELCEQAAVEHDPEKLLEIFHEINRMLEEKEQRLMQSRKTESHAA